MNTIKNIANHQVNHECKGSRNIITPDRCSSAKLYRKKAYEYANTVTKNSILNTETKLLPLYQSRITQNNNDVYPINNYDFDYKTAAIKKFNIYGHKFYNEPTMTNLISYPSKLSKFLTKVTDNKFPDRNDRAGIDDIILNDTKLKEIKQKYAKFKPPYPSFNDDYHPSEYKLNGHFSSSYFIKNGKCLTPYTNETVCKNKKFEWMPPASRSTTNDQFISKDNEMKKKDRENSKTQAEKITKENPPPIGKCYKPKYMYINNESIGMFRKNGLVTSVVNDFMDITPDKILEVASGNSINGSGVIPCPPEKYYPDWLWKEDLDVVFDWDFYTLYGYFKAAGYKSKQIRSYRWNTYSDGVEYESYGNPGEWIFVNYTDKKNRQANDLTKVLFLIKVKFNSNFNLTNSEYKIIDIPHDIQASFNISNEKAVWQKWNDTDLTSEKGNLNKTNCDNCNNLPEISLSNIFIDLINIENSEGIREIVPNIDKINHSPYNKPYRYSFEKFTNFKTRNYRTIKIAVLIVIMLFILYKFLN